jgi:DNA (cytosine-5)-methyltransferase 1
VDVVWASPPCQGFSPAGTRNLEDQRDLLLEAVPGIARAVGARVLVVENVPGTCSKEIVHQQPALDGFGGAVHRAGYARNRVDTAEAQEGRFMRR